MEQPIDNKLIKCKCFDFTAYSCIGKFIPYKKPIKKGNKIIISRFCVQNKDGTFTSAREVWLDCESWKYLESEE